MYVFVQPELFTEVYVFLIKDLKRILVDALPDGAHLTV